MSKPVITAVHWHAYRACQEIGFFNMLDYEHWSELWNRLPRIEWPFHKLTKEEWFEILNNYSQYKEKYEDSIKNCIDNDADMGGIQTP